MYGFDWYNYLSATLQLNQWQAELVDVLFQNSASAGYYNLLGPNNNNSLAILMLIVERVRQQLHGHQPKTLFAAWRTDAQQYRFFIRSPFCIRPRPVILVIGKQI